MEVKAMIQAFSACTSEIDDAELAVKEIVEQLGYEGKLLKNTVGIMSCFTDFIETGIVKALCDALPFDVLGCTTIANASAGQWGETMLCLLALTSDDAEFVTGLSEPILEEDIRALRRSYEEATRGRDGRPSLEISFSPLLLSAGNDFFVESMDEITGGTPLFGALPVDHNTDYHDARVIFKGEAWRDRCAFLLFYGDVAPRFYTGDISKDKIFPEEGTVTASKGNVIQSVNRKPIIEYLMSLGLTKNENGDIAGINSFPIIADYNDGSEPTIITMFAMTPEGYAVCSGKAPVGSTLAVGRLSPFEVTATSANTLKKFLDETQCGAALIFSCIGRYFSLMYDQSAEMQMVVSWMENRDIPYLMAYSGGEACPARDDAGILINRARSNTFTICVI
ncbi:MAG: FIST C-terminal domain-containing protein [Synergistaceae bacterium]|nr:FIST C-terminal domain-containing protein [Synergistaceae bacterium]